MAQNKQKTINFKKNFFQKLYKNCSPQKLKIEIKPTLQINLLIIAFKYMNWVHRSPLCKGNTKPAKQKL